MRLTVFVNGGYYVQGVVQVKGIASVISFSFLTGALTFVRLSIKLEALKL